MQRAVVCGAGGFIGHHLVRLLKERGYWVRGVDQKLPEFSASDADDFQRLDLREPEQCAAALDLGGAEPDEVYQLAADMGGMGFIHSAECEIMTNSPPCRPFTVSANTPMTTNPMWATDVYATSFFPSGCTAATQAA